MSLVWSKQGGAPTALGFRRMNKTDNKQTNCLPGCIADQIPAEREAVGTVVVGSQSDRTRLGWADVAGVRLLCEIRAPHLCTSAPTHAHPWMHSPRIPHSPPSSTPQSPPTRSPTLLYSTMLSPSYSTPSPSPSYSTPSPSPIAPLRRPTLPPSTSIRN